MSQSNRHSMTRIACASILARRSVRPHSRSRIPIFSGDWRLDKSQTVGAAPWGQTHAGEMVLRQTTNELTLTLRSGRIISFSMVFLTQSWIEVWANRRTS
jgi:hypothetical protein